MGLPSRVTMLLLLFGIAATSQFYIDPELMLAVEDGERAYIAGQEHHAPIEIVVDVDSSVKGAEDIIIATMRTYCSTLKKVPNTLPSKFSEMATFVVRATVGQVSWPGGEARDEAARRMAEQSDKARLILEWHAIKAFNNELYELFVSNKLSGSLQKGVSEDFANMVGARSALEAAMKMSVFPSSCDVDNMKIYAEASWIDKDEGFIYRISDPGTISTSAYSYYELPEIVFVRDNQEISEVENCKMKLGGIYKCSLRREERSCKIEDYKNTCKRTAHSIDGDWAVVREFGDIFVVASSKKLFWTSNDFVDETRAVHVPEDGVVGLQLAVGETLHVGDRRFTGGRMFESGTSQTTVVRSFTSSMDSPQFLH